jgi:hypothetical protein
MRSWRPAKIDRCEPHAQLAILTNDSAIRCAQDGRCEYGLLAITELEYRITREFVEFDAVFARCETKPEHPIRNRSTGPGVPQKIPAAFLCYERCEDVHVIEVSAFPQWHHRFIVLFFPLLWRQPAGQLLWQRLSPDGRRKAQYVYDAQECEVHLMLRQTECERSACRMETHECFERHNF